MSNNSQLLTQQGFTNLQAERINLKDIKIPETAKRIDEAKEQGDLSENAEYHQARDEMSELQARLAKVNYILDNAEIMSLDIKNTDTVIVGSTVLFKDNKNNKKEYIIVGVQEADPMKGKISNESPIGKSFLGSKVGDKVKVETPAGINEYKILKIS